MARWVKPAPREIKLNVDASFYRDSNAGTVGMVLRDFEGKFIAARMKCLPHVGSASMAEAIAMKEGLILANEIGCNKILVESDSTEVIEACLGDHEWSNELAAIYANCVDLVTSIGMFSFMHCLREANKVDHSLAKECLSSVVDCNWVDEPPSFILDNLLNNVIYVEY
jgi:ribonuclease HI